MNTITLVYINGTFSLVQLFTMF